jgi:hypothetical protein
MADFVDLVAASFRTPPFSGSIFWGVVGAGSLTAGTVDRSAIGTYGKVSNTLNPFGFTVVVFANPLRRLDFKYRRVGDRFGYAAGEHRFTDTAGLLGNKQNACHLTSPKLDNRQTHHSSTQPCGCVLCGSEWIDR